jgi:ubiquitin-activating enzyme E1
VGKNGDVAIDKLWDRFEVENVTLRELIYQFEEKGLNITMLSSGVSLLYASFYAKSKNAERYPLKLSELVASISKKPIPEHQKNVIFEICVEDETGEDVEVPYVMMKMGN